jgi:large subunit ribosomal protein L18
MINKLNKNQDRKKRQLRVRSKISGTATCPRLNVYRSTSHIYAQIIDDVNGSTLVSASTMEKELRDALAGKTKLEQAAVVGEHLAKKAKKAKINKVVFDRAGYLYTGRVKSLAEGARNAGLKF